MLNTQGMKFRVTKHAEKRYLERFPDGPGLIEELASAASVSRKKMKTLRRNPAMTAHLEKMRRDSVEYQYWMSPESNVFVTATTGKGESLVLTCWKFIEAKIGSESA